MLLLLNAKTILTIFHYFYKFEGIVIHKLFFNE